MYLVSQNRRKCFILLCFSQIEGVIKHAEENRSRAVNTAVRMHEEYVPIKSEVDRMRRDCLGLERLPELHEEEGSSITTELVINLFQLKIIPN